MPVQRGVRAGREAYRDGVSRRGGRPRTAAQETTKGLFPMSKRASKFALMSIVAGFVWMFATTPPAHAQDNAPAATAPAAEHGTGLTTDGARKLGGALGVGLVVLGAGFGIGRIGGSATEAIDRTPGAGGQRHNALNITE